MKKIIFFILVGFIIGLISHRLIFEDRVTMETIPGDSIFTVIYKDSLVPVKEYYPDPYPEYDTIIDYDTIWKDVDTAAILRDYLVGRIYLDTLIDDSSMTIIIKDSISRNKLLNRTSFLKNNREQQIINTAIYSQDGLYLGGEVSLNSVAISGSYIYKKNLFDISLNMINFDGSIKMMPTIGYRRKLNFKK